VGRWNLEIWQGKNRFSNETVPLPLFCLRISTDLNDILKFISRKVNFPKKRTRIAATVCYHILFYTLDLSLEENKKMNYIPAEIYGFQNLRVWFLFKNSNFGIFWNTEASFRWVLTYSTVYLQSINPPNLTKVCISGQTAHVGEPLPTFSSHPFFFWLMSQFWQKTQRRLHIPKKIVPDPFQPWQDKRQQWCAIFYNS
jgi:hypothetical protein